MRLLPSDPSGLEKRDFLQRVLRPTKCLPFRERPLQSMETAGPIISDFVFFRDGKVSSVTDSDGTLRFIASEETENSEQ